MSQRLKKHLIQMLCLAVLAAFSQHSSAQLSTSKKAQKLHAMFLARDGGLYDDPDLARYVERIGQKVLANSDHADREYHFFVIDSPIVNAFTPGLGLIYITRGMLTKLNSEGQLAGVLAHEIGHNVGRHLQRGKQKSVLGSVVAWTSAILAGNSAIKDAIDVRNQVRLSGFRRGLELEADQYAADYLFRSNYDPEEMFGVLKVLKDEERYGNALSRAKGGGIRHQGLLSTHPRTDKRLKQVVAQAGVLPPDESFRGRDELRKMLDGVVVGRNYDGNKQANEERYLNKNLSITFVYPKGWHRTIKGSKIVLKDPEKTIQLKIDITKTQDKTKSSKELLEAKFPKELANVELIGEEGKRDLGSLARLDQQRVALIKVARNSFHFSGVARNNKLTPEQDQVLVKIIKSFRRPNNDDLPPEAITRIYYERLEPGESFADLAERYDKVDNAEDVLRLMNGYYPKGEPEPGTWIKLLRLGSVDQAVSSSFE